MSRSKRYEFDAGGGSQASFRYHGRGRPSAKFLLAMQALACAAFAHFDIIDRACDPRVGDRVYGPCGIDYVEVTAIIPHSRPESDTNGSFDVEFIHSTDPNQDHVSATLGYWKTIVTSSLERRHTFHAVEDDEE